MNANAASRAAQWIRADIQALKAYHVPPAHGMVKLDAMENPYPWPPAVVEAWLQALRGAALNRYPDPNATVLKTRLRETIGGDDGYDLILGNGSDELIQMIAMAVAGPDRVILAPEPTFVMYRMIATYAGMRYVGVPLRPDFGLDVEAMRAAIATHRPAVVFLSYPNNPTGNLWRRDDIQAIISATGGLVVIDEAYAAFASDTLIADVGHYDNIVVMRTLSKLGLAGLRLGYLVGAPAWLNEFDKVRLPYNINVLTQASAALALGLGEMFETQTAAIRRERESLRGALNRLPGITAFASDANFLLFRVAPGQAERIFTGLKERGVLIKNLHPQGGLLVDCLRVTVGTPEENAAFLAALARVIN